MLDEIDVDGDGQINYEEFYTMMCTKCWEATKVYKAKCEVVRHQGVQSNHCFIWTHCSLAVGMFYIPWTYLCIQKVRANSQLTSLFGDAYIRGGFFKKIVGAANMAVHLTLLSCRDKCWSSEEGRGGANKVVVCFTRPLSKMRWEADFKSLHSSSLWRIRVSDSWLLTAVHQKRAVAMLAM